MSYCHIGDKAGHVLCKMIKTQSEQLDEQKWALSLRAQTKLEKLIAAQQQRGLTELVLHHNQLSTSFVANFVNALQNDSYLRSVDLRSNKVPPFDPL